MSGAQPSTNDENNRGCLLPAIATYWKPVVFIALLITGVALVLALWGGGAHFPYVKGPFQIAGAAFSVSVLVIVAAIGLKRLVFRRVKRPAAALQVETANESAHSAPAEAEDLSAEPEVGHESDAMSSPTEGDHAPLPEVHLEHEAFNDAWARHEKIVEAARYEPEPVAEREAPHEHRKTMRHLFSRWKSIPRQQSESVPPEVPSEVGRVDVEHAAELLIGGGATRAIFVSPEGDEGAAAAVLVAREVADTGLRVLLVDLTASGAASNPMLDGEARMGITNLLVSEALFTDAIHPDHYSDCFVMPVGTADPVKAMQSA